MASVKIILPDNSIQEFDKEPTALDVATRIGAGLAKATLGAKINGSKEIIDFRLPLKDGTRLEIVTTRSAEANEVIRHSAAHVMAQAVQELWPETKVTIGPVVESGFYYDFESARPFTPEDLEKIEKRMSEIISRDLPLVREEWSASDAISTFKKMNENFKVEIIQDLGAKAVSVYRQGNWFDLCRGPHVQSTGQIKAIKVLSIAGAYWRGDETKPQLQRIYATAFNDKKELNAYLLQLEEAKKRDHRRVGKDLGLFMFHQLSPGAPFFTGKGTIIYNSLVDLMREMYRKYNYEEVITPQIFDVDLFKTSGHYDHYRDNMYFAQTEEKIASVKPMNCPGHCLLFAADRHSYRDLPRRVADFGRLHRFERSGVMHGLTRVRSFCQDDAHIFCTIDQMQTEIESFMKLTDEVYGILGMTNYKVLLATRPEKRLGSDAVWDKAEQALAHGLEKLQIPFQITPGEGAFYGPKVEIHFVDAIGRSWQMGTIQCDFQLPERFELKYVGEDNSEHRPVMLHRAILGSLERFIGVYLEHCAGQFPTWLAPVQVQILNVTSKQDPYCEEVLAMLKQAGVRAHYDSRNEKLGYKIREAQLQKVPYMLTIGDAEMQARTVSIRFKNGKVENGLALDTFVEQLSKEIQNRDLLSSWLQARIENVNQEAQN